MSLMTSSLKNLTGERETERDRSPYQVLRCHNAPLFEVERIVFNESGMLLALVGKRGVFVMEMPQRWGKFADFEDGREKIICKSIPIFERFFVSGSFRILHCAWYPGSPTDSHIVLLTSDNVIRIINVDKPETPVAVYPLMADHSQSLYSFSSTHNVLMEAAQGDCGVSFDFGLSLELEPKNKKGLSEQSFSSKRPMAVAWPMYVLMGNGDVLLQYTSLEKNFSCSIMGPLHMFPPAEDNYGSDACSIMCIPCQPGALVIATSDGQLYHCVLLPRALQNNREDSKIRCSASERGSMYVTPPEPALYVFEQVELELTLRTADIQSGDISIEDEIFTCPIHLYRDVSCTERYHCSHSAGVHSVALPWLDSLDHFCMEEADNDSSKFLDPSQQAIVEHIICTKPLPSSPPSPILGLTTTEERLVGSTLVCLTATHECLVFPMLQRYHSRPPPLMSDSPSRTSRTQSPLRVLHKERFSDYISKILKRNSSNPILSGNQNTELSQKECFQILTRATQVFREEYIQKQDQAREEIQKRVIVLQEQKAIQQEELSRCITQKNPLRDLAHGLSEKLEECKDKHEEIINRIEAVHRKLSSHLPQSEAEVKMKHELLEMEEKIKQFKTNIKQVKIKKDYQDKKLKTDNAKRSGQLNISDKQMGMLKGMLKQEGEDINNLMNQITSLKLTTDS